MTNLPGEIPSGFGGSRSEEYMEAYGSAFIAASEGSTVFRVSRPSKDAFLASRDAYAEMGYPEPGRAVAQPEPSTDQEAYLDMYRAARLRIAEGGTDIVLPVSYPYQDPTLRRAVIDASHDAGVGILDMRARGEKTTRYGLLKRMLGGIANLNE